MCLFENFRNALLFIGFGTGLMGFEDIFLTYGRTISISSMMIEHKHAHVTNMNMKTNTTINKS